MRTLTACCGSHDVNRALAAGIRVPGGVPAPAHYARDRRVAAWARRHAIPWIEIPQFGVIRRLGNRDGWARRWEGRMAEAVAPAPQALQPLAGLAPGALPAAAARGPVFWD